MSKRDRCYLIPVGGDSLDFIRVRAWKKDDDAMQALKWLVESILRREVPLREGQKVACLTIVSRATELRQLFHTDDPAGVK